MKFIFALMLSTTICPIASADTYYAGTPSVKFSQATKGLSDSDKNAIVQDCQRKLAGEKSKLQSMGIMILAGPVCNRRDLTGSNSEFDSVEGSIDFIR